MYKISVLNLIFAVVCLIYNLINAADRYTDTTPNTELEGLYNQLIRGNVLLPIFIIYLGLSVVLLIYQKRRKLS